MQRKMCFSQLLWLLTSQVCRVRLMQVSYITFTEVRKGHIWIFNIHRSVYRNIFLSTTNKMHLLSQIIYSCKTLYIFRTVFLSIIRSSKPRIQQRYMSTSCCNLLLSGMRWNAAGSSNCLTYIVALYAVLSPWWWAERPSETCRAFYKNK
jgi:hypothetical protein